MKARNGDIINVNDICLFITPTGTELLRIIGQYDSDVVDVRGIHVSGRRWVCNILRLATFEESKRLIEHESIMGDFVRWYNDNIPNHRIT